VNVIPDEVSLGITVRYLSNEVQEKIHAEIERALGIAKTLGGDYQLEITKGYLPAYNHPEIVTLIQGVVSDMLGPEALGTPQPEMGAEDFGYFASDIPGGMFLLGCKIEGDERRHHDPWFDIDEACLQLGAGIMAEAALRLLNQ
jgi:amidohydrolase